MTVATHPPVTSSAISLRTCSPVLVGRSEELRTLLDVVSKPPSIAVIEGEAGIGKTRLVHELLTSDLVRDRWAAWGACQPVREPFPYGPVIEALRGVGTRLPASVHMSPVVGALRPLLPELAPRLPVLPEPLGDAEAERHRLFRAFAELLTVSGPTLLVLEDLHWADGNTLELVRFLTSRPYPGLSVVITCRRDHSQLRTVLNGAYRRREDVTTALIRLAPLDVHGVRQLAGSLLDTAAVSGDFAARLHDRSAGIPFVVEETVRAIRDPAAAARADASGARDLLDRMEVPAVLREAVCDRLSTVSSGAEGIVQTLAVLAVPSTANTISAVNGLPVSRVNAGLLEALRAAAIVEPSLNHYGFRHALARQAVYDSIAGPQRQRLHGRAAAALSERANPPLVQIAAHFLAAGQIPEWCDAAEAAADHAEERGDSGLATELLQDLVDEPTLAGDQLDRLAGKLSNAALGAVGQRPAEVLGRLAANERLSQRTRSKMRLHRGLLLTRQLGGIEAGRTDLALAVSELRDTDPDAAIYGMSVLAKAQEGASEFSEHARWLHKVDVELDRGYSPEVVANVLANHLHTLVQIGSPDAEAQVARLRSHASSRLEHRRLTRAHLNLGDAYGWIGHFDRARRFLRTGLHLADSGVPPYLLSIAGGTETRLDWWTGHWFGLRDRAEQLLERYEDVRDVAAELSLVLGSLAVAGGEWDAAESYLRRPGLVDHLNSAVPVVVGASATMTRLYLCRDENDRAHSEAVRALDILRRKGVWVWAAELLPEFVEASSRTGRMADARQVLAEFDRGIDGRDAPLAVAASLFCHGILAQAAGEHRHAEQHFDDARSAYAALPSRYFAALAAERAAVCRLRTDTGTPSELLSPIATEFDAIGAIRDAARCRHLLRSTGTVIPSRRGRRGYGEELSPRESEVARLIAAGHTNRAIADVLFLSPRTVEHHVAKVLRKSGVRARAELSAQKWP